MGKLLDQIEKTNDIKQIPASELDGLAEEIREFLIEKISVTGGHLASNLGTVELTIALHRALNLPQDKAQLMLDKMQPVLVQRQTEQLQAASIEWANSARTDQEIGGERFQENLGVAKKAMEAYASPELRQLLNESTLGNNPEVIRLFYRVGKDMSEDRLVTGQGGTNKAADPRSLYRASNMNP